jgi:hypothetical protein
MFFAFCKHKLDEILMQTNYKLTINDDGFAAMKKIIPCRGAQVELSYFTSNILLIISY